MNFDNRLMMFNGATMSDKVPIEKFSQTHQSKPFNPLIANIFYKVGFIENWGRGTLNIIDGCKNYGLPKPLFEYEWTAVKVTFYKSKSSEGINEGINLLYKYIKKIQIEELLKYHKIYKFRQKQLKDG